MNAEIIDDDEIYNTPSDIDILNLIKRNSNLLTTNNYIKIRYINIIEKLDNNTFINNQLNGHNIAIC
jgi:hypothetical protein